MPRDETFETDIYSRQSEMNLMNIINAPSSPPLQQTQNINSMGVLPEREEDDQQRQRQRQGEGEGEGEGEGNEEENLPLVPSSPSPPPPIHFNPADNHTYIHRDQLMSHEQSATVVAGERRVRGRGRSRLRGHEYNRDECGGVYSIEVMHSSNLWTSHHTGNKVPPGPHEISPDLFHQMDPTLNNAQLQLRGEIDGGGVGGVVRRGATGRGRGGAGGGMRRDHSTDSNYYSELSREEQLNGVTGGTGKPRRQVVKIFNYYRS